MVGNSEMKKSIEKWKAIFDDHLLTLDHDHVCKPCQANLPSSACDSISMRIEEMLNVIVQSSN